LAYCLADDDIWEPIPHIKPSLLFYVIQYYFDLKLSCPQIVYLPSSNCNFYVKAEELCSLRFCSSVYGNVKESLFVIV